MAWAPACDCSNALTTLAAPPPAFFVPLCGVQELLEVTRSEQSVLVMTAWHREKWVASRVQSVGRSHPEAINRVLSSVVCCSDGSWQGS